MSLKGIRRKRWSERYDCRMHGATVWLLRLSRAFCVAPVSMQRRRSAYNMHISRQCAIKNRIIVTIISTLVFAGMSHDVYHATNKTNKSLWAHSKSSIIMLIPNYLLFFAVITEGAFDGPGRMDRFINYFKRANEIYTSIEDKCKPAELEKMLVLKLFVSVISSFSACIMKTVAGTTQIIHQRKSLIVQFLYSFLYLETVVTSLLTMQVIFTITSISWSLKSLNKCIRRLHDGFPMKDTKTGHNAAVTRNINSFCEVYDSLMELSKQVNATEGRMILILFCNFIMRFIVCVYYSITSCLFKTKISRIVIPAYVSQSLSIMIIIVMLVESCHTMHNEMKTTRILISQLLCCAEVARDQMSDALINFYKNTEICEHVYMPYGVVVISRSYYSSFVYCLTTFLVIIYQFKLSD